MDQLAEGVFRIGLAPRAALNAYLIGDVLVDAGTPLHGAKVVGELAGRTVSAHALTHGHADHVGGSRHVVDALGVPVWAPDGDADDIEAGKARPALHGRLAQVVARLGGYPAVPVARRLREGDEVAGFTVLEAPGHSPGHIAFWRESDRVLIGGDVFFAMHPLTLRAGPRPPLAFLTYDVEQNTRSMRRLAELEPALALFGHGPPLRDPAGLRAAAGG